jgi:hypothetical protein
MDALDNERLEQLVHIARSKATQTLQFVERAKHERFIVELSSEELLIGGPAEGPSHVHVGFPFPLASVPMDTPGVSLQYFLRGAPVRKAQREFLSETLQFPIVEVDSLPVQQGTPLYVDPYTFIGDGFLGLYFRDAIVGKKCPVFSRSHMHMSNVEEAFPLTAVHIPEQGFVVMPDLIDTHLATTLASLQGAKGTNATIALVGRNMLVNMREQLVYWVPREDPLLMNKNIQDYMDDCLAPFTATRPSEPTKKLPHDATHVLMNALSSTTAKDLSPKLFADICTTLLDEGAEHITISTGIAGNGKDIDWCRAFETYLRDPRVELRDFTNLSEMTEYMRRNVTLGITADTSVSHLLNYLGIPNFVICREDFYDVRSLQSLAGSSPLGFTRYHSLQLPLILSKERNDSQIVSAIAQTISSTPKAQDTTYYESLLAEVKLHATENVCRELERQHECFLQEAKYLQYSPRKLIDNVLRQNADNAKFLVHAAYRLSPAYKLAKGEQ